MNTTRCREWIARDEAAIAPFARVSYFPLALKSGHGAIVEDMDGNQFIDLLSSAGSQNLGHAHPKIIEAVTAQMNDYTQFTNAYFYNPRAAQLAERLAQITPGDFPKKVAFGLSGSDSIDGAIKVAKAYTGRNRIIAFEGAYHGSTFGALSVSFVSQNMRKGLGALLPDTYAFPFPNPYRDGDDCGEKCLGNIRRSFESWLPPHEVAAVIIEPLQGDGGLIVPPQGFMTGLAELCKAHGILLICDEVQQGSMRTGKWFGIEHFGIAPDIIVTGKAIGGGLPLSAIIGRAEVMSCLGPPAHLFTMGANATCCAAGLASLDVLGQPGMQEDIVARSGHMRRRLEEMAQKHPALGEVRGLGFSIGIEVVADKVSKTPDIPGAKKLCYRGWQTGILMICFAGNVLRIQPPLVITMEEIDRAVDILDACVSDYEAGKISDEALTTVMGW